MIMPFRTAAVLGAGVMGIQIAAHLANAGLTVYLLDLAADGKNHNRLIEGAFKKALKQSPPTFFTEKTARRVILGNFDDDFGRVGEVDWVIEAVIENLAIKQQMMERLEAVVRDDAIVSTNTSGIPIMAIAQGRSASFRKRFLGTHFFNPPRYLKLLELIPTPDTSTHIVERMESFGRLHLGKGVVIAKDTPNFIANRIGIYVTMLGLKAFLTQRYTIEEIDRLTGTLIGRPKSATFRTADLVGLDTLMYVAQNLYAAVPHDEGREMLQVPELLETLVETGTLGAKTGQGFYKKVAHEILSLNPKTLTYESAKPMDLGDIEAIASYPHLIDRLRALYRDTGRAGDFFRESIWKTLAYSAHRIPEISDSPATIDRAMRWGFGWQMGPFELWDALGFETVLIDMQAAGIGVPTWVNRMEANGHPRFYVTVKQNSDPLGVEVYVPGPGYIELHQPDDELHLANIKANPEHTVWENDEAALLDLGDRIALFECRSKGHTLSIKVVEGLFQALNLVEAGTWKGLVIGHEGANFSAGANLSEMGILAQADHGEAIAELIEQFQTLMQRIHYFPKPIVAAVQGLAIGGGCELVMACPHVVAAAETYIGLVELGVGLIPGAGGLMRMAARSAERAISDATSDIQPFLTHAFETIAMAKVSGSAYEGVTLGYLAPDTPIVMNGDRLLYVAKEEVLCLDRKGYRPPPIRFHIRVLGQSAKAVLDHAAFVFHQGGFISDYDRFLAERLAYVLTGGNLTAPTDVSEDYLLALERETFLPLLAQPKTQERILHMLKTKKPLRN
ncbi:MAG: 3-hydroxyacyl-CoA dehydrogenase NAD-binding domain-containing protein [Cyanobacteria bacterium P01_E01_bin.6]